MIRFAFPLSRSVCVCLLKMSNRLSSYAYYYICAPRDAQLQAGRQTHPSPSTRAARHCITRIARPAAAPRPSSSHHPKAAVAGAAPAPRAPQRQTWAWGLACHRPARRTTRSELVGRGLKWLFGPTGLGLRHACRRARAPTPPRPRSESRASARQRPRLSWWERRKRSLTRHAACAPSARVAAARCASDEGAAPIAKMPTKKEKTAVCTSASGSMTTVPR